MRKNDNKYSRYFKSTRFFSVNHEWYFQTREGKDYGPYKSKEIAEFECRQYVHLSDMNVEFNHSHEWFELPQYRL